MPAQIVQTINGTAATNTAVIVDHTQTPFNLSFAVEPLLGTTGLNYGVQFTLDDVNAAIDSGQGSTTVTWFDDVNVGTGNSAAKAGNYMFPIRALRCNVASASATSSVQFVVLQGMPP